MTTQFKAGDHVRTWVGDNEEGYYCYGEITLIGSGFYEGKPKVLFGDPLYDYDYIDPSKLELITPEDLEGASSI